MSDLIFFITLNHGCDLFPIVMSQAVARNEFFFLRLADIRSSLSSLLLFIWLSDVWVDCFVVFSSFRPSQCPRSDTVGEGKCIGAGNMHEETLPCAPL